MPSSALRVFAFSLLCLSLTHCEIAGDKRDGSPIDDSVLMAFFFSEQYALNSEDDRDFLSKFYGRVLAATPDSTFDAWANPELGCDYSANLGVDVGMRRYLDIGAIALLGGTASVDLQRFGISNSTGVAYQLSGFLGFGTRTLSTQGRGEAARYSQAFSIPEGGGNIEVRTGSTDAEAFRLASPEFPSEGNGDYNLVLQRGQAIHIDYTAPAGTSYVSVRIKDGSNRAEADITCYGTPNGRISIPATALNTFRPGTDGIFELDFVHANLRRNVARVKESIIVSSTRHFQGTIEYYDADNVLRTAELGLVEIR
jgi:hypothetical protein